LFYRSLPVLINAAEPQTLAATWLPRSTRVTMGCFKKSSSSGGLVRKTDSYHAEKQRRFVKTWIDFESQQLKLRPKMFNFAGEIERNRGCFSTAWRDLVGRPSEWNTMCVEMLRNVT
jgi:hypothetical protein